MIVTLVVAACLQSVALSLEHSAAYFNYQRPLVIAHRGASGFVPEHTMQSYTTAEKMGADFVEPDVIVTKDSRLVVNHDANLKDTTNVIARPEFACRASSRTIYGESETGWFSDDFTLEEFLSLRARQRYAFRDHSFDDLLPKVSLESVLTWAVSVNEKRQAAGQKLLGLYIETKYPEYFHEQGFDIEELVVTELNRFNIGNTANATRFCPVILQSFSAQSLHRLSHMTDLPLVWLIPSKATLSPHLLTEAGDTFHGIGPHLLTLFSTDLKSTGVLEMAHRMKLKVHAYTLKDDANLFEAPIKDVYPALLKSGLDGIFAEFPDTMRVWEDALQRLEVQLSA